MVKEFKTGDVTMRVMYIPNRSHKDLFEFEIDDTVVGLIYRYELEELLRQEEEDENLP